MTVIGILAKANVRDYEQLRDFFFDRLNCLLDDSVRSVGFTAKGILLFWDAE